MEEEITSWLIDDIRWMMRYCVVMRDCDYEVVAR